MIEWPENWPCEVGGFFWKFQAQADVLCGSPPNPIHTVLTMKETALLALAVSFVCLSSIGCSATAKIDIPRGSTMKPSNDVQVAFVAKPVTKTR